MQINRHFDEHQFLIDLNGGYSIRPGKRSPAPRAEYERASKRFTARLRSLIDEWLDSARSSDGSEDPGNRRPGRLGAKALFEFETSDPIKAYRDEGGERELIFPPERRSAKPTGVENPIGDSEHEAVRLFSEFMDEPRLKDRLAKCRRCKRYYFNGRKLASIYKKGTHCERCRSKATAERSQKDRRDDLKKRVLSLAVDAWKRWESKPARAQRSAWIAQEVNRKLRPWERIRKNWVTLNQREIGRIAQGLEG